MRNSIGLVQQKHFQIED